MQTDGIFTYEWFDDWGHPGTFNSQGPGYPANLDGNANTFYKVFATISGPGFFITSDTIYIGKSSYPKAVIVKSLLSNGTTRIASSLFQSYTNPHWRGPFYNDIVHDTTLVLTLNEDEYIRISPYDIQSYGQKFNYWNSTTDIINFNTFNITSSTSEIDAHFKDRITNVTIGVNFPEYSQNNIQIGFRDPWLVDHFVSQNLGSQNQGMGAPVYYYHSMDFSDPSFDNYQGVFLNQPYTFIMSTTPSVPRLPQQ